MESKLTRPERMLIALLRASIGGKAAETSVFENVEERLWKDCYKIACVQGVMALAWDGVATLPSELQPPKGLKISWAMAVEKYEARYRYYCETVKILSDLYAQHGIATVQLKGVGLSTYYPKPEHREGGDIDIFTYSADTSQMSHEDANMLAESLMESQGIKVDLKHSKKHSHFTYRGISVENHRNIVDVGSYKFAAEANAILKSNLNPQNVALCGGEYNITIPSPEFNTLFVLLHAMQHYGIGLSLHHVCDWACILKRYGFHLPVNVENKYFLRAAKAFSTLAEIIGVENEYAGEEDLAERMLDEIFNPRYAMENSPDGKMAIIIYKTQRLLYQFGIRKDVLDISVCGRIWNSIIFHILNPKTIFDTGKKK